MLRVIRVRQYTLHMTNITDRLHHTQVIASSSLALFAPSLGEECDESMFLIQLDD